MKISEILEYLRSENIPFSFYGNESNEVERFSSLSHYKKGTFTWVKKRENIPSELEQTSVSLVFCPENVCGGFPNIIRTPESKRAFFACMEHFYGGEKKTAGIGQSTPRRSR